MNQYTLLVASLFAFIAAAIYVYIGRQLGRRHITGQEAKLAWQLFTVWWYGLGLTTLIGGLMNLLGLLDLGKLSLFIILTHVNLLIICIALWGLLYYLVYLFTGNKSFLLPLSVFYLLYYIILVYFIAASNPVNVSVERWQTGLEFETPLAGPYFILVLVFLVFPQIIGSLVYFSLYFKVRDVTLKYRISLVSWSIIVWFGSAFLASLTGLSERDWWQIASRAIGLVAALVIFLAYFPPDWFKQRYGITAITDETAISNP